MLSLRFHRGTLEIEGDTSFIEGAVVDPWSATARAPASALASIANACAIRGVELRGAPMWPLRQTSIEGLSLRPYQEAALHAWKEADSRGIVVLPTGAGKTRVAFAALGDTGLPAAVLCPTRALASQWVTELQGWLGEEVGLIGDGVNELRRVTVLTFESAYRHMDRLGARFGLLVVDEAHHLGGALRREALEACAATARLGLTATLAGTSAAQEDLLGPLVYEQTLASLVGRHLAPLRIVREHIALDPEEAAAYTRLITPFRTAARRVFQDHGDVDFGTLSRLLGSSTEGRRALRDRSKADALVSFPSGKRVRVRSLIEAYRNTKTLIFTAYGAEAYTIASDCLVPVITAETSPRERSDILRRFREGPLRAIVSARVLNEGLDVPDASVAIVVSGTLGQREHVQRVGRVLRPGEGKVALVHELVTRGTSDARRARKRALDALRAIS